MWTNLGSNSSIARNSHARRLLLGATAILAIASFSVSVGQAPRAAGATPTGLEAEATAIAGKVSADSAALTTIGKQYLGAVLRYRTDETKLAATRRALIQTTASILKERMLVYGAAVRAYVASGAENALGLYLASQPNRTTITNAYLGMATSEVNATIATLDQDKRDLLIEEKTQRTVTALAAEALGTSKQARDGALATLLSEQTTLSSVKGRLATLVAAQEAAAERAAEEKAAAAEAAAQAAASATTTPTSSASGPPTVTAVTSISASAESPRSLAAQFAAIRNCEASGDYALNTGNGYYGAYQFAYQTWIDLGGSGLPSAAPPAAQDAAAYKLYLSSGWSSWPACAAITGLK